MIPNSVAVSEPEFRCLLNGLGPFEKSPVLAVAVSGGADSMALAVLASRWSRRRKGKIVALIVDHGLRRGSWRDARITHHTLKSLGIESQILRWRGEKPKSRLQESARMVRYDLLEQCCKRRGILHLLVAHHREDQAETILQRLGHSSGIDGLAGMAAIHERSYVRVLRPCLTVDRDRLRAVLRDRKICWVEDPTNQDTRYERVRLRNLAPKLNAQGLDAASLTITARRIADARNTLCATPAKFLARHVVFFSEGYATIDAAELVRSEAEIVLRVFSCLLSTIGGSMYPPRKSSLDALVANTKYLSKFHGTTLGGCRIVPRASDFVICREAGRCPTQSLKLGASVHWDNRYLIRVQAHKILSKDQWRIEALGQGGWTHIRGKIASVYSKIIPFPALLSLPAIYKGSKLFVVPHLGYDIGEQNFVGTIRTNVRFIPQKSATAVGFPVV